MPSWSTLDQQAFRTCLDLAAQGWGTTWPNPLVGAVLVKGEQIVAQAYHRAAGESHAEILALEQAGEQARGSTLYINLEPCCHQGRTPPCAPRLLQAGVARVVVGMTDPDPRVRGGGLNLLRAAGIEVQGCSAELHQECLELNRVFIHSVLRQRPYLSLKYAMTLDGKVATANGDSRWITGPIARQQVHRERSLNQAILVGSGTALADDPQLNVRGLANASQPIRIVADRRGRLSPQAQLFDSPGGPIWVVHGPEVADSWKSAIRQAGGELLTASDVSELLKVLYAQGIRTLLVEGGPHLAGALMQAQLVQRLLVFVAPLLVGGHEAPGPLAGAGALWMREAQKLANCRWQTLGPDWLLEGELDCDWREQGLQLSNSGG